MAQTKNKNLPLLIIGAVALFFLLKKKKAKAQAPLKTGANSPVSPSNFQQAKEVVSQAVNKMSFLPANNSDRVQYSKDQKMCR